MTGCLHSGRLTVTYGRSWDVGERHRMASHRLTSKVWNAAIKKFKTNDLKFFGAIPKKRETPCRHSAKTHTTTRLVTYYTRPPWHLRSQHQACYNLPLSRARLWVVSQLCSFMAVLQDVASIIGPGGPLDVMSGPETSQCRFP